MASNPMTPVSTAREDVERLCDDLAMLGCRVGCQLDCAVCPKATGETAAAMLRTLAAERDAAVAKLSAGMDGRDEHLCDTLRATATAFRKKTTDTEDLAWPVEHAADRLESLSAALAKSEHRIGRFEHLTKRAADDGPSDIEVAGMVRMLLRSDMNHEYVCVLARDRIVRLSTLVAEKDKLLAAMLDHLETRARGFQDRGDSILNGAIVAEELRTHIARHVVRERDGK